MLYYSGLLLAGAFGAIFGSYCTLFAYRLPIGESCFGRYFGPKSRCPSCNTIIRTRELIPILNWLFTLGRCKSCKVKIPRTYIFIELATTVLFILCYIKFAFSDYFIIFALICAGLVVLAATDYTSKVFPDQVLIVILLGCLVGRVLSDGGVFDVIFSASLGVIFATIFYKTFHQRFDNFLSDQTQAFGYAKLIIITSVFLSPILFLLYFASICLILAILLLLSNSLKGVNKGLGFSLIMPFLWLMFYPPII